MTPFRKAVSTIARDFGMDEEEVGRRLLAFIAQYHPDKWRNL